MVVKGKVYIVGVGPGDYKLMTLRAAECIGGADVIVYDRLVGSRVLSLARNDAELVYVGKMPEHHAVPQEDINAILVRKAQEGKSVARIKGGDPFLFGRGGEEAESLVENGIDFEIVPGVTSAIAVPAYAGIPVTHRDCCSSLHIITGHERPGKDGSSVDYEVLAKLTGTLVFLMGVKSLSDIAGNLIRYGKSDDTPAAVIEQGTTLRQRTVGGTLGDIAQKAAQAGVKSPAVFVVGEVAGFREKLDWFPRGPLAGKRVIVTRAREQASRLAESIGELGGEAVELPVIRIAPPESWEPVDKALEHIGDFQWIVFTSVNGVMAFFGRMRGKRMDVRALSQARLCAVGEATAGELSALGLNADYVPELYTTADLLEGLLKKVRPGEKVLLARADIGSAELSEGLAANGIDFTDLMVYRTVAGEINKEDVLRQLEEGEIDFITFTSSSTVKNFVGAVGAENLGRISGAKVVCIGPVTAKTAEEAGLAVAAVADVFTIDGLIRKLVEISEG